MAKGKCEEGKIYICARTKTRRMGPFKMMELQATRAGRRRRKKLLLFKLARKDLL